MPTTLDQMRPGDSGRVTALSTDTAVSQRLAEMGLVPGTICRVVRLAPMGDPMEIEIDGAHLSLRKAEAKCVAINPASTASERGGKPGKLAEGEANRRGREIEALPVEGATRAPKKIAL